MNDWIDDLEKSLKENETARIREEEIMLHKAKIFAARIPVFWKELNEQIDKDCSKIKEKLPNNREYHCRKELMPNGFRLINDQPPIRTLEVMLNANGQCINLTELSQIDRYSPNREQIDIWVLEDNGLILRYRGTSYTTPQHLSHDLILRCTKGM